MVEDDLQRKTTFSGEVTSKQGSKLRFGMLTVLTNIRSTKVSWEVEDNLWWKTTFGGRQPSVERLLLSKVGG